MTAIADESVKEQELISFGFVESAGVNSIAEFVPSNLNVMETNEAKEKNDFINIFITKMKLFLQIKNKLFFDILTIKVFFIEI